MTVKSVHAGGITHRVRIDGDAGPWIVFSNSLGCTLEMWDQQVVPLLGRHRILRYDTRGHGGTEGTPAPYDFDTLSDDLFDIMDAERISSATFVGLSMGGMLGQVAAIRSPERFNAHLFADTTSHYGPEKEAFWAERARLALSGQMKKIAASTPSRWFTPAFQRDHPRTVDAYQAMLLDTSPQGYAGCCAAIAGIDVTRDLRTLRAPTAVVVGANDPSTTVEHARRIHEAIPDASLHVIPRAAHLSNVEQPEAFNHILLALLQETA